MRERRCSTRVCPLVCETSLTSGECVCKRDHKAGRVMESGSISPSRTHANTSGLRIYPGLEGQKECTARSPMTVMFHT